MWNVYQSRRVYVCSPPPIMFVFLFDNAAPYMCFRAVLVATGSRFWIFLMFFIRECPTLAFWGLPEAIGRPRPQNGEIIILETLWVHLVAKARTYSKCTFWRLPVTIRWPSPQNAQNEPSEGLLESPGIIFMAEAQKCSKWDFWKPPGAISWPRHEHVQN